MSIAIRIMNVVTKPLLRSPFHFLASGWCMLITVRGRKTGHLITTPVYYRREGTVVRFFSGKHLTWVKNLGGAPVTLRLQGRDVSGVAVLCPDDATLFQKWIKIMYPRLGPENTASYLLIEVHLAEQ